MTAKEIATATVEAAKMFVGEPTMPDTELANSIVVVFDGSTFSVADNGEGDDDLTFDEAVVVVTKDIEQMSSVD